MRIFSGRMVNGSVEPVRRAATGPSTRLEMPTKSATNGVAGGFVHPPRRAHPRGGRGGRGWRAGGWGRGGGGRGGWGGPPATSPPPGVGGNGGWSWRPVWAPRSGGGGRGGGGRGGWRPPPVGRSKPAMRRR